MKKEKVKISRVDKILLTMYELSKGRKKNLKFEDIVVALFRKYKEDFHLRGYPQYPDSEIVNKAIYSHLRKDGLVRYGDKIFSLTDKGLAYSADLKKRLIGKKIITPTKLSRFMDKEISRIRDLEGFKLFLEGKRERIIDTDFYSYIGVSVRTEKDEILGRLKIMEEIIKSIKNRQKDNLVFQKILEYHKFITKKFEDIIKYYQAN